MFNTGIALNYMFFAVLNLALVLGFPNSYISGGIRCAILGMALILFLMDLAEGQYGKFPLSFWGFVAFWLYFSLILLKEPSLHFISSGDYIAQQGGKIYYSYTLYIASFGTFLLFFCGRDRLNYLINTPLVFWALCSIGVLGLLYINRGALSTFSLSDSSNVFANRSIVKAAMGPLFAVSLYLLLFHAREIKYSIPGLLGCFLAGLNLLISDSKSSILSFLLIAVFYFIYSIVRFHSILWVLTVYIVSAILVVPYLFLSKSWVRLSEFSGYKEMYLRGDEEMSRLDMIINGFHRFFSSPVFGDGIYAQDGSASCHFLPLEILVPTGLIGAIFMLFAFWGMFRGMLYILKTNPMSLWALGVCVWDISQQFLHGYTFSLLCFSTGFLLAADCARKNSNQNFSSV